MTVVTIVLIGVAVYAAAAAVFWYGYRLKAPV